MRTIRRRQDALSPARTAAGTGSAGPRPGWWVRLAPLTLLAAVVLPAAVAAAAGSAAEPARRLIAEIDDLGCHFRQALLDGFGQRLLVSRLTALPFELVHVGVC